MSRRISRRGRPPLAAGLSALLLLLLASVAAAGPADKPRRLVLPPDVTEAEAEMARRTYALLLQGERCFLGTELGLIAVDIKDPARPRYLGALRLPGTVNGLAFANGKLLAADGPDGLAVIEATDPKNPRLLAALRVEGSAMSVDGAGRLAFVASGTGGLAVVDLTNPARPRLVAHHDTPGYARDVRVRGERIFLADGAKGVRVFRLMTLDGQVEPIATIPTRGHAFRMEIKGDLLFLAEGFAGLAVLDVKDPARARLLGRARVKDEARGVSLLDGGVALVADGTQGVSVIDVSRPAAPREIARYRPERSVNRVKGRGNLAFVSNDYDGLLVLSLENRGKPTPISSLPPAR